MKPRRVRSPPRYEREFEPALSQVMDLQPQVIEKTVRYAVFLSPGRGKLLIDSGGMMI